MLYNLKRFFYSVFRFGPSHGFGIQSPFAYRFVKDVVRETYPYYAYDSLAKKYPNQKSQKLRLLRFYLRLANYLQAKVIVSNNLQTIDKDYFKAGCKLAVFFSSNANPDVVLLQSIGNNGDNEEKFLEDNLNKMSAKSVLIIEDIQNNKLANKFWRMVIDDKRVGITFDLFDCGIAFFDLKMQKNNYKLMLK